jgi:pimeloyl-ACP methyl ester carboxylesterase
MKHELPYFKNDLELSKIKKPTLIVHGDSDSMVPFSMAEQAASQIEGSTLRKVEGGNHCIPLHDDGAKIFQEQVAFVKSHNQ